MSIIFIGLLAGGIVAAFGLVGALIYLIYRQSVS